MLFSPGHPSHGPLAALGQSIAHLHGDLQAAHAKVRLKGQCDHATTLFSPLADSHSATAGSCGPAPCGKERRRSDDRVLREKATILRTSSPVPVASTRPKAPRCTTHLHDQHWTTLVAARRDARNASDRPMLRRKSQRATLLTELIGAGVWKPRVPRERWRIFPSQRDRLQCCTIATGKWQCTSFYYHTGRSFQLLNSS